MGIILGHSTDSNGNTHSFPVGHVENRDYGSPPNCSSQKEQIETSSLKDTNLPPVPAIEGNNKEQKSRINPFKTFVRWLTKSF